MLLLKGTDKHKTKMYNGTTAFWTFALAKLAIIILESTEISHYLND